MIGADPSIFIFRSPPLPAADFPGGRAQSLMSFDRSVHVTACFSTDPALLAPESGLMQAGR
jgi:hypothetical protein